MNRGRDPPRPQLPLYLPKANILCIENPAGDKNSTNRPLLAHIPVYLGAEQRSQENPIVCQVARDTLPGGGAPIAAGILCWTIIALVRDVTRHQAQAGRHLARGPLALE